jgi:hypothetical protein
VVLSISIWPLEGPDDIDLYGDWLRLSVANGTATRLELILLFLTSFWRMYCSISMPNPGYIGLIMNVSSFSTLLSGVGLLGKVY